MNPNEFETQTRQEIRAALDRVQTVAFLISEMELELVAVSKAFHDLSQLVTEYANQPQGREAHGTPVPPVNLSHEKSQDSWIEQDDW